MVKAMKKARILVVGSFVMDLIVRTRRFVNPGETILGEDFTTASGGKGANQAVQAALLGAQVDMLGKVGNDDFGRRMLASLKEHGVNISHVMVTDESSSAIGNIQIQENEQGTQNRIVVIPAANMLIRPEEVAFLKEDIKNYDMVMLQHEIPLQINELVAAYAHAAGVPVMLNPAPTAAISDEHLANLTYISPNEHEGADLVGFSIVTEEDCRRAIEALLRRGVKNVMITRGSEGAVLGNAEGLTFSPCVKVEHVADPTAAGDSFVAAFCTATCVGIKHQDAMLFAAHAASITVSRMGAQPSLPSLAEVFDYMQLKGVDMARFAALKA